MPFWISTVLLAVEMGCFITISLWYLRARRQLEGKKKASAWDLYCRLWAQHDEIIEAFDSLGHPQKEGTE